MLHPVSDPTPRIDDLWVVNLDRWCERGLDADTLDAGDRVTQPETSETEPVLMHRPDFFGIHSFRAEMRREWTVKARFFIVDSTKTRNSCVLA